MALISEGFDTKAWVAPVEILSRRSLFDNQTVMTSSHRGDDFVTP
ncbi:hypothetical protein [Mesorhizobium sp. C374B]|nr:hypothetical protein [Mesorhizobium sp. C374B]